MPFLARCYGDVIRRLGIRTEAVGEGRAKLVASAASDGAESLASLSEIAMALAYTSIRGGGCVGPPATLRIGFFVVRTVWSGAITASAEAHPCGGGWLLDCEVRDDRGELLSTAFGHTPD